jgi:hypothetical protein
LFIGTIYFPDQLEESGRPARCATIPLEIASSRIIGGRISPILLALEIPGC